MNLNEKVSMLFFDLDGTLVDSLKQIEKASNVTRINFGYVATPRGQIFKN